MFFDLNQLIKKKLSQFNFYLNFKRDQDLDQYYLVVFSFSFFVFASLRRQSKWPRLPAMTSPHKTMRTAWLVVCGVSPVPVRHDVYTGRY